MRKPWSPLLSKKDYDYRWKAVAYFIEPASAVDAQAVVGWGAPEIAVSALTWIAGIDAGRYSQSWKDAADYFQSAMTEDAWVSALEGVRKPLGLIKSRAIREMKKANALPGAPDGEYLIIQYDTSFSAKEKAVETVTFMKTSDDSWKAAGYFIH